MFSADWWVAVAAIAAVVQALILAVAAVVAWKQVSEARTLRKAQTRPYVIAYLRLHTESPSFVEIVVENIGATPAESVHVEVDPPFKSSLDQGVSDRVADWGLVAKGVAQIAPHQQLSTLADVLHSRFGNDELPRKYDVTITYGDGLTHEKFTSSSVLDFDAFHGKHFISPKNLGDLVDPVKKIASVLDSWSGPPGAPGAVVLTKDYQTARDEILERWNNWGAAGSDEGGEAQVPDSPASPTS